MNLKKNTADSNIECDCYRKIVYAKCKERNMDLKELYKKYHIISDGLQRKYVIDVCERRFDLDFVTPIEIVIIVPSDWCGERLEFGIECAPIYQKRIENRSWVQLLKELVIYLQGKAPKEKEELLTYRTDWSKAAIFSETKTIDNMVEIEENLYFSVNYTATHSSWIIGDLLTFYGIKEGYLVVHRTPNAEPKEVREAVGKIRREEFKRMLMYWLGKDKEKADRIIRSFDVFNKILVKMGTSYNDFFLFDETLALSNYKARLLKDYYKYTKWDEKQLKAAQKYLDYLTDFYTKLKKTSKKSHTEIDYWMSIMLDK